MVKSDINGLGKWSKEIIDLVCDSCGIEKSIKYKLYTSYGYSNGSYFCRKCKTKKNNLEKWGVENPFQLESVKEKSRKTNLEKFGVEFISQSSDIKEKIKKSISELDKSKINKKRISTNQSKYGVDNVSQINEIKEKKVETSKTNFGESYFSKTNKFKEEIKKNNLEKFGVEHFFQSDEFMEKSKISNLIRYDIDIPSKNNLIKQKIKDTLKITLNKKIFENINNIKQIDETSYDINCTFCEKNFKISKILFYKRRETKTEICTICNPIDKHQSGKEIKLYNLIKSLYIGEIIQNFKIGKQEIDIYLPSLNLGFELNGIWWHSDKFKSKNFHKEKSEFFLEKDIRIIHIWEDDFDSKFSIIKSQIINLIGLSNRIWARKCHVKEVTDINSIRVFLDNNHIQGYVNSNLKLGLYYNDELVSLMTFDHFEGRKRMNFNEWNLNRFCNKLEHSVVGGASKLLKYFIKNYDVKRIISYADRDWSKGDLYENLGFIKIGESKPDYKYLVNDKRVHKSNFKKSITGISESNLDIYKVWDCGKIKFELFK
jgi:hypothetical protein